MKKKIAIFTILIANIIILAHTALPEHHCHHQEHMHDECGMECSISESMKLFTLSKEKLFRSSFDKDFDLDSFLDIFQVILAYLTDCNLASADNGSPFHFKPYVESVHLIFLTRSLGLRSPPSL